MEIKAYALIDANGDYVIAADEDGLIEKFAEDFGDPTHPTRVLEISISLPTPSAVKLAADVGMEGVDKITMQVT